jgi:hypothetical protein
MTTRSLFQGVILIIAILGFLLALVILSRKKQVSIVSLFRNQNQSTIAWNLSFGAALLVFLLIFIAFIIANN